MKQLFFLLFATVLLIGFARANELFQIASYNTLVTAHRSDLATFMVLNARPNKPAVRALYNVLESGGLLLNIQPGTVVEVEPLPGCRLNTFCKI
jgi:hypothetical protein